MMSYAPVVREPMRLPRTLHPMAWWLWALGLATAASRTTNPFLLAIVLSVVGYVVASRRSDAPWARALKYYLALAVIVVAIRVTLRVLLGGATGAGDHVLFRLPTLPLPRAFDDVRVGGPVSLEGTLSAAVDGMRLACLLCCVGAANALANPKRALRALPGALYELGVAVVVAMSVAPQLVESVQRVRRARALRAGRTRGFRALRGIALPVLEDALDRSLRLAAAMDSRGYGRTGNVGRRTRHATAGLLLAGMVGLCLGGYGLLDGTTGNAVALPALGGGAALSVVGLLLGGRRVVHTRYRPDPWRWPEWGVAACGIACAALLITAASGHEAAVSPSFYPLALPPLPVVPTLAILIAALAGLIAPPPVRRPIEVAPDRSRTSRAAAVEVAA